MSKKISSTVTVIGNGESRQLFDPARITTDAIGCNAIVRDCAVNRVVCVDRQMALECAQFHGKRFEYLHTRWEHVGFCGTHKVCALPQLPFQANTRPDQTQHWGSGPYAVLLAATLYDFVQLVGFDLYSDTKTINNVYKGTENYAPENKRAVDPRYWIHQISRVFECFPKTEFTIYQTPDWQLPEKWNCTNVQVDKISNFTYT